MLNTDSARMQAIYQNGEVAVDPQRRASLVRKGKRLYKRYVTRPGIFAEGFVAYHLWCGEYAVVQDFLTYLNSEIEALESAVHLHSVEQRRLAATRELTGRIEVLMHQRLAN